MDPEKLPQKPTRRELRIKTWIEILQSPSVLLPFFMTLFLATLSFVLITLRVPNWTAMLAFSGALMAGFISSVSLYVNGTDRYPAFEKQILENIEREIQTIKMRKLQSQYEFFAQGAWDGKNERYKQLADFISEFLKTEDTFFKELQSSAFHDESKQELSDLQEKIFDATLEILERIRKLEETRKKIQAMGALENVQKELKETRKKIEKTENLELQEALDQKIRTLEKKREQFESIEAQVEKLMIRLNKGKMLLEEATLEFYNVDGASSNMDRLTERWNDTMEVARRYREDEDGLERSMELERVD